MPSIVRSVPVSIVPAALRVKEPVSVWATFRTRQVAPPVVEKVTFGGGGLASVWKLSPSKTLTALAVTAELVNSTVLPALPRSWMSLDLPGVEGRWAEEDRRPSSRNQDEAAGGTEIHRPGERQRRCTSAPIIAELPAAVEEMVELTVVLLWK